MSPHQLRAAVLLVLLAACAAPAPAASRAVVEPGDEVTGTGNIVLDERGKWCLYGLVLNLGGIPRPIEACPPNSVLVQGVDVSGLAGWTAVGDSGYTGQITVRGTWTGEAVRVESVVVAAPRPRTARDVPCPAPAGGWPVPDPPPIELEEGLRRLGALLEREPARYSGYWMAAASASEGLPAVAVVGTVEDPGEAQEDLESVYPFALCVVRVEYSMADLEQASSQLLRPDGSWANTISSELDRVIVRLPLVDQTADAVLSAHPEATADPIIWPSAE